MWKIPGTWNLAELPKGSRVRALLRDTVIVGTVDGIEGEHDDKQLIMTIEGAGTLALWARDYWRVELEVPTFAEVAKAGPVGARWVHTHGFYSVVKVSSTQYAIVDQSSGIAELVSAEHFNVPEDRMVRDDRTEQD